MLYTTGLPGMTGGLEAYGSMIGVAQPASIDAATEVANDCPCSPWSSSNLLPSTCGPVLLCPRPQARVHELNAAVHSNMALCFLKLEKYDDARAAARSAVEAATVRALERCTCIVPAEGFFGT